jgi:hypothetical protein
MTDTNTLQRKCPFHGFTLMRGIALPPDVLYPSTTEEYGECPLLGAYPLGTPVSYGATGGTT